MITPEEYFQETDRMLVQASINSEEYPLDKEVLRAFYGWYGPHEQFKDWCNANIVDTDALEEQVDEAREKEQEVRDELDELKDDMDELLNKLEDIVDGKEGQIALEVEEMIQKMRDLL